MTRALLTLTRASVAIFAILYVVAARLYPGGTRLDRLTSGFSFRDNYWCDLLDETAYCGAPNRGQPVAFAAMLVLCVGLAALWWTAPAFFPSHARRRTWVVRVSGLVSSLLIPLVGTRHHDRAINLAGLFALVAFTTTALAIGGRASRLLRALAVSALLFSIATWAVWQTRVGVEWLAVAQKGAFFFFLAWVFRQASELRARA